MKSLNEFISEVMTSAGGGVAGMHQNVIPTDSLPKISGREADRLAIAPRKKRKKKKEMIGEQSEHEITVGDYTTKFFYMCGSAQKVMKQNADVEGAEELTRMQDDFYKLEKEAMDAGEASDEQKEQAKELYNKIMQKAGEIDLADDIDDYMKMHIDSMTKNDPKLGFGRTDVSESISEETFAGCRVFELSSEEYINCMRGRPKYERWDKKLNMEDLTNQEIRSYAHKNPGKPVLVKDSKTGVMSYLIPPRN